MTGRFQMPLRGPHAQYEKNLREEKVHIFKPIAREIHYKMRVWDQNEHWLNFLHILDSKI
jgi:hypothetical protein